MKTSTSKKTGTAVYETADYDLFSLIPSNRPIYENHLKALTRRISKNNKLAMNPIRVSPEGKVLDGQHRLKVAEALGVSIYYYFDDTHTDIIEIAQENYTTRRWTLYDVLNHYCELGRESYLALRDFMQHHPWITASVALAVCDGKQANSHMKGKSKDRFVEGEYEIKDMSFGCAFASAVGDFMQHYDFADHKPFQTAVSYLLQHPQYDHERMMRQVEQYGSMVVKSVDKTSYLRQMEALYNHRLHEKNRSRFF